MGGSLDLRSLDLRGGYYVQPTNNLGDHPIHLVGDLADCEVYVVSKAWAILGVIVCAAVALRVGFWFYVSTCPCEDCKARRALKQKQNWRGYRW